jgi:hypothetical protein
MVRSIVGAVVGYVVMVVVVVASIAGTWAVLGPAGSFDGEGPYPSTAWTVSNLLFGLLGAVAAGWVALKLGRSARAVKILVGLILVLGLWSALTAESSYEKRIAEAGIDKPVADLTFLEAGRVAKNRAWYNWSIPLVGVAGVLLGGRGRK